jgi:peptidoglycan hydrolase FlgJ
MSDASQSISMQSVGDLAMSQAISSKLGASHSTANIDKTSKDFEGMFFSQMLQPMFEGLGVDPIFGGGHGEEVMRNLLVQEYGKMVSKGGRLGIADAVKKEMIRAQGGSTASTLKAHTPVLPAAAGSSTTPIGGLYDTSH